MNNHVLNERPVSTGAFGSIRNIAILFGLAVALIFGLLYFFLNSPKLDGSGKILSTGVFFFVSSFIGAIWSIITQIRLLIHRPRCANLLNAADLLMEQNQTELAFAKYLELQQINQGLLHDESIRLHILEQLDLVYQRRGDTGSRITSKKKIEVRDATELNNDRL